VATTGGTGIPFSIPAKAKNAAAAAAFIDFITSDDAMAMIAENGGMPVNRTAELAPDKGVNKDIYEAFDADSTEGTLLPYLDYATPSSADRGVKEGFDDAVAGLSSAGTLLPYLDYATPSCADTAGATLQEVIGGQATPEAAAGKLQEDYADFTEGS